ncbi:MAG: methionyl-tRNA formyltransferase [bacterium]
MRVLFMGTPDFACPALEGLVKAGVTVIGVFTQADRPKGRGQALTPPPVKQAALAHHLPVFQPARLSHETVDTTWAGLNPDAVVVVAYGFILPPWILHGTSMGCINLHASLLPRHRGAAPINWAIIRGDEETGVTTMLMDEGMDTGPILLQERIPISPEDTAGSIHDRLSLIGADLVVKTLEGYRQGIVIPRRQPDEGVTIAPKLDREIGRLDWTSDAVSLWNLIRGINPHPGAFTFLHGRMIKIWHSLPVEGDTGDAEPGTITDVDPHRGVIVQTGKGRIALQVVQPENKKKMSAQSFLSGYRERLVGEVFTRFGGAGDSR